jgi:hypothetical protein
MWADLAGKSKTGNVQDYLYLGTSKLPGGLFALSHTARHSRDFLRECTKYEKMALRIRANQYSDSDTRLSCDTR